MTSKPFATTPRRYINSIAIKWISAHWLMAALPLAAAVVWSLFDVRAIYVALILLFLVYPMALTLVWFDYAFSPGSIRAITEKEVTVTSSGLSISFLPKNEGLPPLKSQFIAWDDINSAEMTAKSVELILGKRLDERLVLPADCFSVSAWEFIIKKTNTKLPSTDIGLNV